MTHFKATAVFFKNDGGWCVCIDTHESPGTRVAQCRRPNYDIREAQATAEWLTERAAGYPVPANLAHLQSASHVRRIKTGAKLRIVDEQTWPRRRTKN